MTTGQSLSPAEFTLPDGRVIFCTNQRNAELIWHEMSTSIYLREQEKLPDNATIIDVGAHFGLFSLHTAGGLANAKVIACEPARATFDCLSRNFAAHLPGGIALQTAVADRSGTVELTYYPGNETIATIEVDEEDDQRNISAVFANVGADPSQSQAYCSDLRRDAERYPVPVTTVAQLFSDHDLDTVDLLKIDVERAELAVLQGIGEENWPKIRTVSVEVHDLDGRLNQVLSLLTAKGYRTEQLQQDLYKGSSVHIVRAHRP
ncbi:FkbM family methyltransferase [Amycolatopsis sp. NPDC054798]